GFHDTGGSHDGGSPPVALPADPDGPTRPTTAPGETPRRRRSDREPGLLDPGGLLHDSGIGEGRPPRSADPFDGDDEHFERPPVPPAPPMQPITKISVIAIVAGILLLLAPAVISVSDVGVSSAVGALLVAGGTVGLVLRLRDEPPDD